MEKVAVVLGEVNALNNALVCSKKVDTRIKRSLALFLCDLRQSLSDRIFCLIRTGDEASLITCGVNIALELIGLVKNGPLCLFAELCTLFQLS